MRGRRARLSGRFWDTTFLVILFQLLRHHHRCKYYVVKFYVCAVLGFTFYFDSYAWDFWRVFKFRHTFLVSQINMLIFSTIQVFLVFGLYHLWFGVIQACLVFWSHHFVIRITVLYKFFLYFGCTIS